MQHAHQALSLFKLLGMVLNFPKESLQMPYYTGHMTVVEEQRAANTVSLDMELVDYRNTRTQVFKVHCTRTAF